MLANRTLGAKSAVYNCLVIISVMIIIIIIGTVVFVIAVVLVAFATGWRG